MKQYLTQDELCEVLNISRTTLYEQRKKGLPVEFKIGNSPRFDLEKVIEWLKKNN